MGALGEDGVAPRPLSSSIFRFGSTPWNSGQMVPLRAKRQTTKRQFRASRPDGRCRAIGGWRGGWPPRSWKPAHAAQVAMTRWPSTAGRRAITRASPSRSGLAPGREESSEIAMPAAFSISAVRVTRGKYRRRAAGPRLPTTGLAGPRQAHEDEIAARECLCEGPPLPVRHPLVAPIPLFRRRSPWLFGRQILLAQCRSAGAARRVAVITQGQAPASAAPARVHSQAPAEASPRPRSCRKDNPTLFVDPSNQGCARNNRAGPGGRNHDKVRGDLSSR